ncbi:hypothetical protein NECID01_0579 [Nematocida sp. AWRm77]|nr:hypothetical protein NECID01_0579 [Nematocida sp. AWRm77]
MYFRNRSFADKLGLCLTYSIIFYFGVGTTPSLLYKEIQESTWTRGAVVALNVFICIVLLLFVKVSSTRGYLKEEEYVSGGKFCYECRTAKAERAHHCSRCQKCINRMDHHCPWIGACVNGENAGNFTKLIACALFCICIALGLYGAEIKKRVSVRIDLAALNVSFFVLIVNFILLCGMLIALLALFIRQIRLIATNTTYLESLQIKKLDTLGISYPGNPYDKGCLKNMKEVFGTPLNVFLCTVPEEVKKQNHKTYWPPVKTTRSSLLHTKATNKSSNTLSS